MSQYTLVKLPKKITAAQHKLDKCLASEARRSRPYKVGFPGGDMDAKVRYLEGFDLWHAVPADPAYPADRRWYNRYWNAFGLGDPKESLKPLTITVEINPSFTGSRRCAGLFLHDTRGDLYLGHTGNIRGHGVSKRMFRAEVRDWLVPVDKDEELLIGGIDLPNFTKELDSFVRAVHRLKEKVKDK